MWAFGSSNTFGLLRSCVSSSSSSSSTSLLLSNYRFLALMEKNNNISSFSTSARSRRNSDDGGGGKGLEKRDEQIQRSGGGGIGRGQGQGRGGNNKVNQIDDLPRLFLGLDIRDEQPQRSGGRGRGGQGGSTKDNQIESLGRLLTRILRHMASELQLNMRTDGYVKVDDILKLDMKTFANIPLRSHTVDDVREAVRKDNKQRFGLLEENGELFIRANQGHTIASVESESLLKPILSAKEAPVCVHGTYKKNLESILQSGLRRMTRLHVHFSSGLPTDGEVISGMRRDVNVLIFLDIRKALEDGMKIYISENKVILTEGFDGVVPVKYIEKIETWPKRRPIPF